jgi:hypothetical protein
MSAQKKVRTNILPCNYSGAFLNGSLTAGKKQKLKNKISLDLEN